MSVCFFCDQKTRIEFEAREKALKDKTSSLNYAKAEGLAEGEIIGYDKAKAEIEESRRMAEEFKVELENSKLESAKSLLDVLDDATIANKLGLDVTKVSELREETE